MPLRLIFMGTPDFAVPTLNEIVGRGHEVVAVYTRAPKPADSAESTANVTHASVSRPETIKRLRPVARTASRALSSSHTFMLRRSIGSTPGSADLTAGISGPLYTFVAEVVALKNKELTR